MFFSRETLKKGRRREKERKGHTGTAIGDRQIYSG
jgi:hypothetical protein